MNKMDKSKNKTYTMNMMNKRENMTEAQKLVAIFLKKGGNITVCAPSKSRFKTFNR
tara:strand:- start:206 stop:373 length:168 start_codon:yes stop_codon:yes gene_type:complete